MIIFPAIDIIDGKAVRLYRGDYSRMTVYSDDPAGVAVSFREAGAEAVHIVDLDGARAGGTPNFETVAKIKEESGLFCEVGGGVRSLGVIRKYIDAGIDRVIIGTAAVTNPPMLIEATALYGGRIAVSADVKNGRIAIRGWTEKSGEDLYDFCERVSADGISNIICTDISKDGAMRGTNIKLYRELARRCDADITASGGITKLSEIEELRSIGLYGAIVGKAYYSGAFTLEEALTAAK